MIALVDQFKQFYQGLDKHNIGAIEYIYDKNIEFIDPFHEIHGLKALTEYFEKLYENVNVCHFDFSNELLTDKSASLYWTMRLSHRRLNNGKSISVPGSTLIRYDDKVTYHRDYFDAGALLYENIPVLRNMVNYVKGQL